MENRSSRKFYFFFLIILYFATSTILSRTAGSSRLISIAGYQTPLYSFAGIFSSLSNICIIFLVVYFKKPGFITSLTVLLLQCPLIILNVVSRRSLSSIAGLFSNLVTIIAIIIIYINNITLKKYQDGIRRQAVTDRLTDLPNRFACTEMMNKLISEKTRFAFVSIDLNNFKNINDTMGHSTGNSVLYEVAKRWKEAADKGTSGTLDYITRLGGDEFSLIIRNYKSSDDIVKTLKHYASLLEEKITIDDCEFYITASFGYTEFPMDATKADALFSFADAAMYEVKTNNSSNHILRFTPDLLKEEHTLETERVIRTALNEDRIFFHLQPQFDINHKLRGMEALARLTDKDGKPVCPGEFIPVAEKTGLIDKVDSRVFRKSAEYFGGLIKRTGTDAILSINVSVRHLMKNDFLNEVRDILKTYELPARQLEIEITESIMLDSADKALMKLNELRKMGIRIAIDDFGTGYSSLSYLNRIPASLLKIDKSFIDTMNTNESSRQYVAAIISMGHIMNMEVISEGVETEEQLNTLRKIDCDFIQGYIWGRPLPSEEFDKLVV